MCSALKDTSCLKARVGDVLIILLKKCIYSVIVQLQVLTNLVICTLLVHKLSVYTLVSFFIGLLISVIHNTELFLFKKIHA